MDLTIEPNDRRREPRFPVINADELELSVQLSRETQGEEAGAGDPPRQDPRILAGKLSDLSRSGARFTLDERLEKGQFLTARVAAPAIDLELQVQGRVSWCGPRTNEWDVGCQFVKELPDEALGRLAAASYLERRRDQRSPINGQASLSQTSFAQPALVEFKDISHGGFRISVPHRVELNEPLLLEHRDQDRSGPIKADAQWQLQDGEEFLVGCSFRNASSSQALRDSLLTPQKTDRPISVPLIQLTYWGMMGLVFAFVYCLVWALRGSL